MLIERGLGVEATVGARGGTEGTQLNTFCNLKSGQQLWV